ncbi:MAG: iron chelate uptake ABC transporter family permease subunit [Candidatus Hydrogenedentota bacterium]
MKNNSSIMFFLLILFVFTVILSLIQGPVDISCKNIFKIIFYKLGIPVSITWDHNVYAIIMSVRIPRVLLGILVGMALAVSGCAMQSMFRNPMAGPYIVGIASGASFGASVIIIFGWTRLLIVPGAFLFSLLTAFCVYYIARVKGKVPVETLLLAGIAVSLFFSAMVSFTQYYASESNLREIVFWLMGGLWKADWYNVLVSFSVIVPCTFILYLFNRELNALMLGEEVAQNVGVKLETTRKIILVLSSLITAAAVSVSGVIGFVGLIVPHIMRMFVGPNHRILVPASAFAGGILLVWMDTFARRIISPTELPVGIITAILGVPFFLFLLRTRKKTMGF